VHIIACQNKDALQWYYGSCSLVLVSLWHCRMWNCGSVASRGVDFCFSQKFSNWLWVSPILCSGCQVLFSLEVKLRCMKLTSHLVLRLRFSGGIPLLPICVWVVTCILAPNEYDRLVETTSFFVCVCVCVHSAYTVGYTTEFWGWWNWIQLENYRCLDVWLVRDCCACICILCCILVSSRNIVFQIRISVA